MSFTAGTQSAEISAEKTMGAESDGVSLRDSFFDFFQQFALSGDPHADF